MHILPNISQSKGNEAIKFGQLIEYNKTNNFLQKFFSFKTLSSKKRHHGDYNMLRTKINFYENQCLQIIT